MAESDAQCSDYKMAFELATIAVAISESEISAEVELVSELGL
jgi:hypothetical protein